MPRRIKAPNLAQVFLNYLEYILDGGARDELSSMSKIEGESFVKMRTNLGTRVLGRVSCTHYFMSIHILRF